MSNIIIAAFIIFVIFFIAAAVGAGSSRNNVTVYFKTPAGKTVRKGEGRSVGEAMLDGFRNLYDSLSPGSYPDTIQSRLNTMEMDLATFCTEGLKWKHEVKISSMCTVFAESEVVSLVADDTPVPDIIHGLDRSVGIKVSSLSRRVKGEPPYLMTGGVAKNEGVVAAIEEGFEQPIQTSDDSQLCGALGAALLGLESLG